MSLSTCSTVFMPSLCNNMSKSTPFCVYSECDEYFLLNSRWTSKDSLYSTLIFVLYLIRVQSAQCLSLLLIIFYISQTSAIPLIDLDSDGNPTDLEVSSYACNRHFWFYGEWYNGKRQYIQDPPYSSTDSRILRWRTDNQWECYKPETGAKFKKCTDPNLFDCYTPITVRYQIIANQSEGWYTRIGTDDDGSNIYYRESTPDRYVIYDINTLQWIVTNESIIYATCASTNFFACDWVQTGVTASPTAITTSPTINPTLIPTMNPTMNPTINPTIYPTLIPTMNPTMSPTINPTTDVPTQQPTEPTQSPTKRPTIKANTVTTSPTVRPTEHPMISTTMVIEIEVIPMREASYTTKFIVYLMASILCCCVMCVIVALFYKYFLDRSDKDIKEFSNVVNAPPLGNKPVTVIQLQQMQRERVFTESQYAENDDDDKEHEISEEGDVDTTEINVDAITAITAGYSAPQLGSLLARNDAVDFKDLIGRVRGMTGGGMDERMEERKERQRELLKEWLTLKVKLPDYYDVLVDNGYESLDIIKEVTDEQELRDIGIALKGHILKIMREIQRLNSFKEFIE